MIFNKRRLWLTAACLALVIPTVFLVYRMLNSPTLAPTAPAPQTAQSTPASPVEPKTPAPETTSPPAVNRHDTLMVQAKNALENKEFNRSIALYQQIVKRNAADLPNIRADYSNALHSQADKIADERPDQARQLLTSAVDINPRNARAYFDLGHLWTQSQNHLKATQAYRASADLGYRPPETFYNLGYNYAALREYALAEQMFRHAVTLNPPYLDKALYNLAVVQHKQGKKQLCIENLEKALNHNPDNLKAKGYLKRLLTYKDTTWINVANSTP
jgi:tetratricopeptide (TPR) repeat protein